MPDATISISIEQLEKMLDKGWLADEIDKILDDPTIIPLVKMDQIKNVIRIYRRKTGGRENETIIINRFSTKYDKCYDKMEKKGDAVFITCHGLAGGDSDTDYLNSGCIGCPYLVLKN